VGLRAFLVAQGAGSATGAYSLTYLDEGGNSSVVTGTTVVPTASSFVLTSGDAATNRYAPFIPMASGDFGITGAVDFTWTTPPGGICALVIVKPIAQHVMGEIGTPAETVYFPRMPTIHPDAFLAHLRCPSVATPNARNLSGMITTLRS
jgi:hypothetical protein